MILVAGATGTLGRLIASELLDRGKPVRILVRPGSDHASLVARGAEPVFGDLRDRPSLDAACQGVQTVVTTANSALRREPDTVESVDLLGNRSLIDAASEAGVRHFVFISANGATPDHPAPFVRAKAATEAALRESGMTWTIVAPEAFAEVWIPMIVLGPALQGREIVYVGSGARRHSLVSIGDVAAFAVASVDAPEARDAYLSIGGPGAWSYLDAIAIAERALGHPLARRSVPPGEPIPGLDEAVAGMLAWSDTYDSVLDTTALAATFGVRLTPLEEVIARLVRVPVGV